MAEKEGDFYSDEGKSAKFNAGMFHTQRINKILDTINFCKCSPIKFNSDYLEWNYNVWLSNIKSLYDEIDGFLTRKEREECIQALSFVEDMIEKYPIMEDRRTSVSSAPVKIENKDNWKIIKKAFEYCERVVKRYGISYQVIAATTDDDLDGL